MTMRKASDFLKIPGRAQSTLAHICLRRAQFQSVPCDVFCDWVDQSERPISSKEILYGAALLSGRTHEAGLHT